MNFSKLDTHLMIRINYEDKSALNAIAKKAGFPSTSLYIRNIIKNLIEEDKKLEENNNNVNE